MPSRRGAGRVLLVTTHYHPVVGGVETHARDVATGLRARGRRVIVLTTKHSPDAAAVQRVDNVAVVRTRPDAGRRRWTKWAFLPVVVVAAVRLRRHFDVIFCPDLRGIGLAAIAAGWWLDVPVVLQGATPGAYSASHWDDSAARLPVRPPRVVIDWLRTLMFRAHRRAAAAVCITREHQREALASGIPAARIRYIPHGVDTRRFAPATAAERAALRRSLGLDDQLTVLYLGRLSREKGLLELLEAWRQIAPAGVRLLVVGPDVTGHSLDAGPAARAFVEANGLGTSVRFAGATEQPALYLRASDVLTQPSHYEAFPVTVIEAMACGLAVTASFVGGLRDYLIDGENALVHAPHDVAGIRHTLERLIADAALRARLGRTARATIEAQFDRERNLDAYGQVFDSVLSRP
jgi:glycosyltransferase involved in cell wall biosynthesis